MARRQRNHLTSSNQASASCTRAPSTTPLSSTNQMLKLKLWPQDCRGAGRIGRQFNGVAAEQLVTGILTNLDVAAREGFASYLMGQGEGL